MPYKDPQKAKESARRRYLINIDKIKKKGKDYYENNKDKVTKQHAEKSEELKLKSAEWRGNNKDLIKEYKIKTSDKRKVQGKKDKAKSRELLKDEYLVSLIAKQTELSREIIKQYPELIQNQRSQIKVKRLIKNIKHGKQ